jgi:hypothetical protein
MTAPCSSWCASQLRRYHMLRAQAATDTAAEHQALWRHAAISEAWDRLWQREQPTPTLRQKLEEIARTLEPHEQSAIAEAIRIITGTRN